MPDDGVFYRGGPNDGQIHLGIWDHDGVLVWDLMGTVASNAPRFAYDRLAVERVRLARLSDAPRGSLSQIPLRLRWAV